MKKIIWMLVFSLTVIMAWDGSKVGVISELHVAGNNNYDLRIYLEGVSSMCGTNDSWAYLNSSDSNFNGYMSVILMARATNRKIKIYTNKQRGGTHCHIGYLVVY